MSTIIPSIELMERIEQSEIDYMADRMGAISERPNNPEGVEVVQIGQATCFYSKTMPWPAFNTVKGIRNEDADTIDAILSFYQRRDRKPQFEIVPSLAEQPILQHLAKRGFYASGTHASLYIQPTMEVKNKAEDVIIHEIQEDEFEIYANIHCRGTGLSLDGIPYVAANNKVLYYRPNWKFFMAYVREVPAAVGVMHMKNKVTSLTFAATLPEFRRMGLQQALLYKRIEGAAREGCDLVVGQCSFLSQSHRNMERAGMRLGYVRTTWTSIE
ncbi:GNAT family N-acetyltransferase [Paenibacillus selenitireducens]|uniref:GNAT family N-acetyltransferase n=1 Tax=Paenibacillus selenitireducens TaxID=1324314 RepID=A0A1T2XMZ7_9BACL|nr:GNAT family N-acetyltransferase [Paenibacillus selenitireducens]OPA81237.1 GNAT family N-acetyltransferase [Paenibacillus selenitireducens]